MRHLSQTIALSDHLRAMTGPEVIAEYANHSNAAFDYGDEPSLPVIICARDEAEDLPATLVSLANSERQVWPIVVDDASHDGTSAIAEHMGATVLPVIGRGKIPALQTGLRFLDEKLGYRGPVLATDADTIVGAHWSDSLFQRLQKSSPEVGRIIFGPVVVRHGASTATDTARSIALNAAQAASSIGVRRPGARGSNMGMFLNERSLRATLDIFPVFPGADVAIRESLGAVGIKQIATVNPRAMVVTRGDRFATINSYTDHVRPSVQQRAPSRSSVVYS